MLIKLIDNHVELLMSRDKLTGATPLHKAVLYQRGDLVGLIVNLLPVTMQACDNVSKIKIEKEEQRNLKV